MPFIFTPGQLARQSEFYHQLAALTVAGVGVVKALEIIRNSPPSRWYRPAIMSVLERLNCGSTLTEALASLGRWIPQFDLALLEAGEKSGRLDICFRLLSDYYNERASLSRSIINQMLVPALTVHFAVLIFPTDVLAQLFMQGEVMPFVQQKLVVLVPLYLSILLLIYFSQGRRSEGWRDGMEKVSRMVPVLGSARRKLALARLSISLEGLMGAGAPIIEAWEAAAASSGSPALARAVRSWRPSVEAGQTPAEMVQESGLFPELFANLYSTGEVSGQLDDALRRLYRHYREEGTRELKLAAEMFPRVIYLIVVFLVAYQVISFWSGYFSGVMKMIEP